MLVLVSTTATAFAGNSALRPTGQVDQSTPIVGELRRDLLAGTCARPACEPSEPGSPDSPSLGAARRGCRSAVCAPCWSRFARSRDAPASGSRSRAAGSRRAPFACLPPCTEPLCIAVFSEGPLPRTTRVLVGRVQPRVTELRITGRQRACSQLPRQPEPYRAAAGRARPRPATERARHPRLRGRHGGRLGALPEVSAAQKTGSSPSHSRARFR